MSQLERAYRIDQLLNDRGVVGFDDLMHALEVSRATLMRDLAYLRDRLNAPIVHDRVAGGYRFKHPTQNTARPYELPGIWFSAEEIHALLTMQHLLANLDTGGLLGPHIKWSGWPKLDTLDDLGYKAVIITFPMLTIMIILGSVWANVAWGRYWSWDPKETAALVTWLIYGAYLHARVVGGWRGKRAAWLLVLGFAAIIFTYFGNLFFGGMHSYA